MFKALHRVVQGILLLLLAGALWLLWEHREKGRPLLDLYVVWEGSGYHRPDPMPRSGGTVSRVVAENIVEFRDHEGRTWNVGLKGLGAVIGDGRDPVRQKFSHATQTNLTERLVGRPVEMAWVETNANRTALGFAYLGTNSSQSLAVELVATGRLRWLPEDTGKAPLLEQMRLRGADRRARVEGIGLFDPQLRLASPP